MSNILVSTKYESIKPLEHFLTLEALRKPSALPPINNEDEKETQRKHISVRQ